MHLAALAAHHFRCIEALSIEPHPRLNLFVGANAAGKTSVLECIHALGRAQSFRGAGARELCMQGHDDWLVRGVLEQGDDRPRASIGVAWQRGEMQIRIDQRDETRARLVALMPVQIVDPAQHRLLEDGPGYRRRFLDWGVFHVEPSFLGIWRRYERVLRQRNRALREGRDRRLVQSWDRELIGAAERMASARGAYLQRLMPVLETYVRLLLPEERWSVELYNGWRAGERFGTALQSSLERDLRVRQTVVGPHRAELRIRVGAHGVRNRISRGQQKLLIAALVFAQARLMQRENGRSPVLLIDDFTAELGDVYQARLVQVLAQYEGQLFVTALGLDGSALAELPSNVFHVEHGKVDPA